MQFSQSPTRRGEAEKPAGRPYTLKNGRRSSRRESARDRTAKSETKRNAEGAKDA